MSGKIISFEGTDGSGKETQAKLLVEKLNSIGINAKYLSFPEYGTPHARPVEEYLQGAYGEVGNLSPLQVSTLYAFDRSVSIKEHHVIEELEKGTWFVMDRYTDSNVMFQTAMINSIQVKNNIIKQIRYMEETTLNIPQADLAFFLYLPISFSTKLVDKRGQVKDIHEKNYNFLQRVEANSLAIVSYDTMFGRRAWYTVEELKDDDNIRSIEDISEEIFVEVLKRFKLNKE